MKKIIVFILALMLCCGAASAEPLPMATPSHQFDVVRLDGEAPSAAEAIRNWQKNLTCPNHDEAEGLSDETLLRLALTYVADATPSRAMNEIGAYSITEWQTDDLLETISLTTMDGPMTLTLNRQTGMLEDFAGYRDNDETLTACQSVVSAWYAVQNEMHSWDKLLAADEATSIAPDVLLRLTLTWLMDAYSGVSLKILADFEPRISLSNGVFTIDIMTHQGDVTFRVDAATGSLINSRIYGGGNG